MSSLPELDHERRSDRLTWFGLLCSRVSHELRNPLSAVLLNAQLAMQILENDSPLRIHLHDILLGAQRMESYLDRLQQLARPGPPEKMSYRISELAEQSLKVVRAETDRSSVRVFLEWQAAETPPVFCDPLQIRQALVHLLENAIEAMPRGGEIHLSCRWCDPAFPGSPGVVELQVEDTGCGIPPQDLDRAPEPFFTTKPNRQGLGLTVAWLLVEVNGGTLRVESEPGRGTRLILGLPASSSSGNAPDGRRGAPDGSHGR